MDNRVIGLLNEPLVIINIGVKNFADSLLEQDVDTVNIDWSPPAGGDKQMIDLLDNLL